MTYLTCLLTGLVATAVMDLWGLVRKPLLGQPVADYRFVGRWITHLARGRLRHDAIARTPPVQGEQVTGWIAHYTLGLLFAAAFLACVGAKWLSQPTLMPALSFGLATVIVPFGVLQPAMGLGVAARRAPRPTAARLQSLITHAVFGFGLYLGGRAANFFYTTGD